MFFHPCASANKEKRRKKRRAHCGSNLTVHEQLLKLRHQTLRVQKKITTVTLHQPNQNSRDTTQQELPLQKKTAAVTAHQPNQTSHDTVQHAFGLNDNKRTCRAPAGQVKTLCLHQSSQARHNIAQSCNAPRCPHPGCPYFVVAKQMPMHHKNAGKYIGGICPANHKSAQCFHDARHPWSEFVPTRRGPKGKALMVHRCVEGCKEKFLCDGCSAVFKSNTGVANYHPKSACPRYLETHPEVINNRYLRQLLFLLRKNIFQQLTNPKYKQHRDSMLTQLHAVAI